MEVNVKMDDALQECVDRAIEEVKELLLDYLKENPELDPESDDVPCLQNDLNYDGGFNEIVDSNMPIYYNEIDAAHYLHGDDLDEAYNNSGLGDRTEENYKQVAIYIYIEQKVSEWYGENAEGIFNPVPESNALTAEEEKVI